MIKEKIEEVLATYQNFLGQTASNDSDIVQLIKHKLPRMVEDESNLFREYIVKGSAGQGNIAEIPWVCVFDREITTSAERGFYVVYLFQADMGGVYLSLNQGWTQYKDAYGTTNGRIRIKENADRAKNLLRSIYDFNRNPIQLNGMRSLSKGYELGNICSKYYSRDRIPKDSVLINDLRNLIGIYRELKGLVGLRIFEIENVLEEEEFQSAIQNVNRAVLPDGPLKRSNPMNRGTARSYPRDHVRSRNALIEANFRCEYDDTHETFLLPRTGQQYMEGHHLIPMEFQENFEYSIDVPENIISLCPNCHEAIHKASRDLKRGMLRKFHDNRSDLLNERGIEINFENLCSLY